MFGGEHSEAETLGAAVWLWMHSPSHRDAPLHTLPTLLLPAIKKQQFVLVSQESKPVFYFAWAWMDEEAEYRYLTQPAVMIQERDWTSGDRMWVLDWVSPFGHTTKMKQLITDIIFPNQFGRFLYHKGAITGKKIKTWRGKNIDKSITEPWYQAHPLANQNN